MAGSSVLALAAAGEDDWEHGKREDEEPFHGVRYGRIGTAVLILFIVATFGVAGAAAGSSPRVVRRSSPDVIRAMWLRVSARCGSRTTPGERSSESTPERIG